MPVFSLCGMYSMCTRSLQRPGEGIRTPRSGSYRGTWATVRVLRMDNVHNNRAISPPSPHTPFLFLLNMRTSSLHYTVHSTIVSSLQKIQALDLPFHVYVGTALNSVLWLSLPVTTSYLSVGHGGVGNDLVDASACFLLDLSAGLSIYL